MKRHVHVYKVVGKAEVNFDEKVSEVDAQVEALKKAKAGSLTFGKSDCKFIAMVFPLEEEIDEAEL